MNIVEFAARLVESLKAEGHKNPAVLRDFKTNAITITLDKSGPPTSDMGYHTVDLPFIEVAIVDDYQYEVRPK